MRRTSTRIPGITLALAASALLGACGPGGEDDQGGGSELTNTTAGGALAGDEAGTPAMSRPQLAGFLSMVNLAEVESGRLAQEKATNARVRAYARMVVSEHSGFERQLGELGQRIGLNPERPSGDELQSMHEQMMTQLRQAPKGRTFDSLYIAGQVMAHRTALQRINSALTDMGGTPVGGDATTTGTTVGTGTGGGRMGSSTAGANAGQAGPGATAGAGAATRTTAGMGGTQERATGGAGAGAAAGGRTGAGVTADVGAQANTGDTEQQFRLHLENAAQAVHKHLVRAQQLQQQLSGGANAGANAGAKAGANAGTTRAQPGGYNRP